MNDQQLDDLVAAAAPITDDELAALGLAGAAADLCEAIMSTPHPLTTAPAPSAPGDGDGADIEPTAGSHRSRRPRRRRLRDRLVISGIAAAVAAAAVTAVALIQPFGGDDRSAWAAEAVAVAEAVPRLLVTADGWEVASVDEFAVDAGEMSYTGPDHTHELELLWGTGTQGGYDDRLAQWSVDGYERLDDITAAGHQATLFRGPPAEDGNPEFIVLWPDGEYGVELRGIFPDLDQFLAVMATVEEVDVDTWLSSLPASVVRADDSQQAVAAMLADVPLPPGADAGSITPAAGLATDREILRAEVVQAVQCAWVERWAEATAAGDAAAVQEAVEAMSSAPEWDVVQHMDPLWAHDLRRTAEAMAADGALGAGLPDMPSLDELDCGS